MEDYFARDATSGCNYDLPNTLRTSLHGRPLPWLMQQVHNYPRRIVGFNTPMGFLYLQMFLLELDNY